MIRNFMLIALRNLEKYKTYSLIKIFGLVIGMACFMLVLSFVLFETSYDQFHEHKDRIYQAHLQKISKDYTETRRNTGAPLAPLLEQEFAGISHAVRLTMCFETLVRNNVNSFQEKGFFFADAAVFEVLTFPLISGDPKTALKEPFTIVLTQTAAKKYFGNENPVGKSMQCYVQGSNRPMDYTITGVMKDIPANSHLKFDFLASYSSVGQLFGEYFLTKHWDSPTLTYIQLQPGVLIQDLQQQMDSFAEKFIDKGDNDKVGITFVPLKKVYYDMSSGPRPGDWGIPYISGFFLIIAFLILLTSCISFVNISTATGSLRMKEIGVRKSLGAKRGHLIWQFIIESAILSTISLVCAFVLVELILPLFQNNISALFPTFGGMLQQRIVSYSNFANGKYWLSLFAIALLVGIIAGFYPALYLARLKTVQAVGGHYYQGEKSGWFRKALVVLQFTFSILFLTLTLYYGRQINACMHEEMGFDKEHIITIRIQDNQIRQKYTLLKEEWLKNATIKNVTCSSMLPGGEDVNGTSIRTENIDDFSSTIYYIDADFCRTMDIDMLYGKDYNPLDANEANTALLINRKAMQDLGWQNVNGQSMQLFWRQQNQDDIWFNGRLLGVTRDFHFKSPIISKIQPLVLAIQPGRANFLLVKIDGSHLTETLSFLKSVWNEFNFMQAFNYSFLDEEINNVYSIFFATKYMVQALTLLSISISCLGLYALAAFSIDRKTKEIGIQKVFGASVKSIVMKLSGSFLLWIAIANVFALPLAWYVSPLFIASFIPYSTSVTWWLLLAVAAISFTVGFFTVGFKAYYAATANPIQALRHE
jgi:putative ABC transport system permease protein